LTLSPVPANLKDVLTVLQSSVLQVI